MQKLADGKCWTLTNLAYAGGGTNTYSDVVTLSDGTNDSANTFTQPKYYTMSGKSNPTSSPTAPSTSTDGGATGQQYGYYYNWCAAMGAQTSTSACASATTPPPNVGTSVCPANWHLPTGGSNGEFAHLASAVGATDDSTGSTNLRTSFLAQYGGYWYNTFIGQGTFGNFWSSTQTTDYAEYTYDFDFRSSGVSPSGADGYKYLGYPVRCLAN